MKKLLFSALAVCAIALGFSACSSDDDDEAKQIIVKTTPLEAVDLGLSIKWANKNVGANGPEGYGEYFGWGDSTARGDNWATDYKYNWEYAQFNNHQPRTFNQTYFKQNMDRFCPNGTLAPEYDAATQINGSEWRMPTESEWKELYDSCTWVWTTVNSIDGYEVTGPNGNKIFLPAAGKRNSGSLVDSGRQGYYWSSTLDEIPRMVNHQEVLQLWYAFCLYFRSNGIYASAYPYEHFYGFQIRPVHK